MRPEPITARPSVLRSMIPSGCRYDPRENVHGQHRSLAKQNGGYKRNTGMHNAPCHSMWNGTQNKNGLLLLDACGVDDLLPARDFARQVLAEILRCGGTDFETLRGKPLLDALLAHQR